MRPSLKLSTYAALFFCCVSFSTLAQSPCRGGEAAGYPCNKVELLSHVGPLELLAEEYQGSWLNDIWGWTDPLSGKEYALVGMTNGTSFVDISNPRSPVVLGILPEHHAAGQEGARRSSTARATSPQHDEGKSTWRDIKVYQNYAYIVSEDAGHGVQVFDLTQLRTVENPPVVFQESANYQGISNAHNIVINEETGFAFAVGSKGSEGTCNEGGLHIIDIRDPLNPQFAGCFDGDGYTHDAQCVVYTGPDDRYAGKEICFASNVDALTIVDVTDKENPVMLSSQTYVGFGYAHQGWLTEDQRFFISNDELDEANQGLNTQSYIWNVQDLENPVLIGTYTGPNPSIDHNLYIKNGFVYEANYTSGLQILDHGNVENGELQQVAFFDTYPLDNDVKFKGAWSNYPFFESGVVVVSDITNGLFVLRPHLGAIQEGPQAVVACAPGAASFSVVITAGSFSYQWQVDEGAGFTDLQEGELYSQVNASELQLSMTTAEMDGFRYRVKVTDELGEEEFSESAFLGVANQAPQAQYEYRFEKGGYIFRNLTEEPASYLWTFGDGTSSTAAAPTHWYESDGTYEVTLTATNDCGTDVYSESINVVTAIGESELSKRVKVYPNPVSDILTVEMLNNSAPLSLSIIGADGRELLQKDFVKTPSADRLYLLDISSLSDGVYFLQLVGGKTTFNRKIIVRR